MMIVLNDGACIKESRVHLHSSHPNKIDSPSQFLIVNRIFFRTTLDINHSKHIRLQ